jgi:hypothetical protein
MGAGGLGHGRGGIRLLMLILLASGFVPQGAVFIGPGGGVGVHDMAQVHLLLLGDGEHFFDKKLGVFGGGVGQQDAETTGVNNADGVGGADTALEQFDQAGAIRPCLGAEDDEGKLAVIGSCAPNAFGGGLGLAARSGRAFGRGSRRCFGGRRSLLLGVSVSVPRRFAGACGGAIGSGAFAFYEEEKLFGVVKRDQILEAVGDVGSLGTGSL